MIVPQDGLAVSLENASRPIHPFPLESNLQMAPSGVRIFISYSSHDKELLEDAEDKPAEFLRVLRGLSQHGVTIDYDRGFLDLADQSKQEIIDRLDKCDIFLPILSDDFLQSRFCREVEVARALERREEGHHIAIAPFYYKYCVWRDVPWVREVNFHPVGGDPFQAITSPHLRTKSMIEYRLALLRISIAAMKRKS